MKAEHTFILGCRIHDIIKYINVLYKNAILTEKHFYYNIGNSHISYAGKIGDVFVPIFWSLVR